MYNVLIVDDEELITDGMKLLIDWQASGFRIIGTASDGLTALELAQRHPVDLVVTDVRMPELDGLELIAALRESGSAAKVVILSGYGDFQYAKKAISFGVADYLLKPVEPEELDRTLAKLKAELDGELRDRAERRETRNLARDKLLSDFACGVLSYADLGKRGSRLGLAVREERIRIGLVELTLFPRLVRDNLYDAMLYRYGLRNMLEETIEQPGHGFVYEEAEGLIGIVFQPGLAEDAICGLLTGVLAAAREWFRQEVVIGVGDPASASGVPLSRKQALYALERNRTKEPVRFYRPTSGPDERFWDMELNSDELIRLLEEGDLDKLAEEVRRVVRETEARRLPKPAVEGALYSLLSKLGRLIARFGEDPAPLMARLEREYAEQSQSGEPPFAEWLVQAMTEAGQLVCQLARKKEPSLIASLLEFIDGHYAENLSIKQLSGLFYMNPAYLGQLFKQKTGESFNDYLNKARISAVKKELMHNRYAGMETIHRAGFANTEYFYRQFKRYEGIAFSEFRDRLHTLS
ncbi:response regulator transcription factor [Gorillibacterium sp. sgz500922]|uniref:response regulator transcription factor n=1 Tax=Gorillibacterium sp. sgz500922 TaxID=3446694 RepID=UPI003F671D66